MNGEVSVYNKVEDGSIMPLTSKFLDSPTSSYFADSAQLRRVTPGRNRIYCYFVVHWERILNLEE